MGRTVLLEINSYTDPVKSNLQPSESVITSAMQKYHLSKNDVLSAYRTASILNALKAEINVLAGKFLSREEVTIVIDRLNKEVAKTKISVGATSFKLSILQ